MNPTLRKRLAQIGSFVLAGVLMYLALRGVEFDAVWDALRTANYWWLLPMTVAILGSHALRAWRWKLLLEALPPEDAGDRRPSVSGVTAFYSLMIGYMVNYAAPRLGELARTANLAQREKLRFSSVLGTVVAERVLDMLTLLVALASVLVLFWNRLDVFAELLLDPLRSRPDLWLWLGIGTLVLVVTLVATVIFVRAANRQDAGTPGFWHQRVRPLLTSFQDGLRTLWRTPRRGALLGSTVAIWFGYLLLAHMPFLMLGMAEPYGLTLLDAWAILNIGALGVAIPSPGGTGSYHYITIQLLVLVFAVGRADAATYAVLTHAAQLILYVIVGVLCLILQGASVSDLREQAEQAQATTPEPLPEEHPEEA